MVFPNHMTTAMTSLQLASFWILPQVNNVAAYRINLILDQTQWVACLFIVPNCQRHHEQNCFRLVWQVTG